MKGDSTGGTRQADIHSSSADSARESGPSLDTLDPLVLLRQVRDHLIEAHPASTDAPGHSHDRPGRWDGDGSPCAWCAVWQRVQACLEQNNSSTDSSQIK